MLNHTDPSIEAVVVFRGFLNHSAKSRFKHDEDLDFGCSEISIQVPVLNLSKVIEEL